MNPRRTLFRLTRIVMVLGAVLSPSLAEADWENVMSMLHPYLSLTEEYTDNLDLSPNLRDDDWITTTGIGLRFSTLPARPEVPGQILDIPPDQPSGIDLDYMLGLVFYAKHSEDNYMSHSGRLNAWTTLGQSFRFNLRDVFVRSQEPREPDYAPSAITGQLLPVTTRQRSTYIRNIAEPSLEYRFGREDSLALAYRHNIYEPESDRLEKSQEHYINPRLTYWFNIRSGVIFEYGYTQGDFERHPDLSGHLARGRYTYRFSPRMSVFGDYVYLNRNFDFPGIDYEVHTPTLGIEYGLSPAVTLQLQAGYYWQYPAQGKSEGGFSGSATISRRDPRTSYTLQVSAGYLEDYYSSENLGFGKAYRSFGSVSHSLTQRFRVGAFGSLDRIEYVRIDRKDWSWRVGGNASYRLFRWLDVSAEYSHQEYKSNIDLLEYKENRAIFRLNFTI